MKEKRKLVPLDLVGDVDVDMTLKTVKYVNHLKRTNNLDPIEVILCTTGGYVVDGFAVYDLLANLANPVHIHCVGACMSAGTIILGAADFKTATHNTQFLVHYGESYADSEDGVTHNKRMNDITKDILAGYTGKTKRTITNWYKRQKYFLAEEALKLGFIDEIQK